MLQRKVTLSGVFVRAAELTGLYPEEIEWAVEEFGLSDNEAYVAVGQGGTISGVRSAALSVIFR